MTAESKTQRPLGVPRRTVTKTAAWSVPAVTTVLAAPALAASLANTVDLTVEAQPYGRPIVGYSPDRQQLYRFGVPAAFTVYNQGAVDAPAGATVTLSFDSRAASGALLDIDETAIPAVGTRTDGNLTTVSFLLPREIAVGGSVTLGSELTTVEPPKWGTDIEPYTVAISAPEGTEETVLGNNSFSSEARYEETCDGAVSVTWRQHDLVTEAGEPLPIYVQDTVTLTANAPGDVPSGSSLVMSSPTAYDGSEYVDVYEDVTITSAALDGQDVSGQVDPESSGAWGAKWRLNLPIEAGQVLVLNVDVDVTTSTREYVHSAASVSFDMMNDRDEENNEVFAGLVE